MTAADQPLVPGHLLGALLRDVDGEVSSELRSKAGRGLARHRWSRVPPADRAEATARARQARWQKWLNLVDPDCQFTDEVREMLAREARRAHMSEIAMQRHHGPKPPPLVARPETIALFREGQADDQVKGDD